MDDVTPHSRLRVATPVFDGPLELLLALVERQDVDILEVKLATITHEYLEAVALVVHPPPEEMAGFLWMAARLLMLKSVRLLPGEDPDEEALELLGWEEDVRRRLDEYRMYKEVAAQLMERGAAEAPAFPGPPRPVPAEGQETPLDLQLLVSAFQGVLARVPPRALTVSGRAWTMEEKLASLESRLRSGPVDLVGMILACEDRLEAVVTFVALLELLRRGDVKVRQQEAFGAITVELARR